MLAQSGRALLALALVAPVSFSTSGPAIGLAVAKGSFQIDNSRVWGNVTLFDGNTIQTNEASSQLQLSSGTRIQLASNSRARIYQRQLVLEKGIGQLETTTGYQIEARTLRISPAVQDTVARVQLNGPASVLVASLKGTVRVRNADGVLVANLNAGRAVNFSPQAAGAAAPTKVSGCLLRKSGKLIVADQTTNVVMELRGNGLEQEVGNRVEITGSADSAPATVAGASQLLNVSNIKRLGKGGCSSVARLVGASAVAGAAGAGAAAAGAGTAAAAGFSAGATAAIVGGVAAAAVVGGLAAAGALPGQGESPSSASR